jgi:GNAT superfamily N-acetyltransferase
MTPRRAPSPPEVIGSIVGNLSSFWRLRAERDDAAEAGIIWWTSGGQRRPLNGVLALSAAEPGPDADRIAATFRLSGLPCAWLEGPDPASPALGLRLLGLGYQALESSHGWALPIGEARQTARTPPGLLVRHGSGADLANELVELVGRGGLGLGEADLGPLEQILRPRSLPGVPEEVWIGLADGEPVVGLLTHPREASLGIFALTTLPDQRGQGFATALVLAAVQEASNHGFAWAVTETPEAHAAPFHRLGFDEYCDFRRYGWEPRPGPAAGV